MASQITSLTIVCSTVNSGADQRKYQRCASLAFVRGFHREPVNSPHKWPVTRKMFPFGDVIMVWGNIAYLSTEMGLSGINWESVATNMQTIYNVNPIISLAIKDLEPPAHFIQKYIVRDIYYRQL